MYVLSHPKLGHVLQLRLLLRARHWCANRPLLIKEGGNVNDIEGGDRKLTYSSTIDSSLPRWNESISVRGTDGH